MEYMLNDEFHTVDLETATRRELLRIKMAIKQELIEVQSKLEQSEISDWEGQTPDWAIRARTAKRYKETQIEAIESELELRRTAGASANGERPLSAYFLDVARRRLHEDSLSDMLDEAREMRAVDREMIHE